MAERLFENLSSYKKQKNNQLNMKTSMLHDTIWRCWTALYGLKCLLMAAPLSVIFKAGQRQTHTVTPDSEGPTLLKVNILKDSAGALS